MLDFWCINDEMDEAPFSPSTTKYAVPSSTEYARAADGDSKVTAHNGQGSSAAPDYGIMAVQHKTEPLRKTGQWVSAESLRTRPYRIARGCRIEVKPISLRANKATIVPQKEDSGARAIGLDVMIIVFRH